MQVTVQSRKQGDYITVDMDDGTTLTSLPYYDRISFAAALRELALQILKDPITLGASPHAPTSEVLQK